MIDLQELAEQNPTLTEDELEESAGYFELEDFLNEEIDIFRNETLQTKKEILESVKETRRKYNEEALLADAKHTASFYRALDSLLASFYNEVELRYLPDPLNEWWDYSYVIENSGVKLLLNHFNWSHSYGSSYDCFRNEKLVLFEVPARMMTVSEFARINGVEPVTVRQWLRRAKIRNAIKYGREWLIPELTENPKWNRYSPCHYYWSASLTNLPHNFEYLNEYKCVFICQNKDNAKEFIITLYPKIPKDFVRGLDFTGAGTIVNEDKEKYRELYSDELAGEQVKVISGREREELELYLIGNPMVESETETHRENEIVEIGTEYCELISSLYPDET